MCFLGKFSLTKPIPLKAVHVDHSQNTSCQSIRITISLFATYNYGEWSQFQVKQPCRCYFSIIYIPFYGGQLLREWGKESFPLGVNYFPLTHLILASHKWDIVKQRTPR